jgi:tRNA (guanine37-N1)-methyltransferase
MKIDILTLFPKMFEGPFRESIINRAQERTLVEIEVHDLRPYGIGRHQQVDDRPYGGGVGMVLMVEPIYNALKDIRTKDSKVILMSPQGKVFNQATARALVKEKHLILVAGRYEGFDERIREHLADEELSIGDYVLTGGELPAMVIAETVARLIPGVLDKSDATEKESFSDPNRLEHPQYTHPSEFNGWKVPDILLSGHHGEIEKWKEEKSKEKTKKNRPDLG